MSTQIAIPIDTARKQTMNRILRSNGFTARGFLLSCIDALIIWKIKLGVITYNDIDDYMTDEERKNCEEALEEYNRGDFTNFDTLDEAMKQRWITK